MNSLKRYADPVYCIMRVVVGLLFACHGAQKILGWFAVPGRPPQQLDTLGTIGAWIELVFGLLLAVGLFTRVSAFISSGMMAVAFFMAHFKATGTGWIPIVNRGELAVVYCWLFLYMFFYGPGRWAIDSMMRKETPLDSTAV